MSMMIYRARAAMRSLFTRHLFLTNVISCGGLITAGDCIIQNLERLHFHSLTGKTKPFDLERTGRMFAIGLILGPFNHHWYRILDKVVTGTGIRVVVKKIAADQAVAGPFFCSAFLIGTGLMEGTSVSDCVKEWKEKFPTVYMADWCIWPPAQFINFYFLPSRFRVIYVAMVTLVWNTFLSFIKHREVNHQQINDANSESKSDSVDITTWT